MGKSLPLSDWPDSDRQMWQGMTQKGGPFDHRGALAHLRETSLRMLREPYGRWLQWLSDNANSCLVESPAMRATVSCMKAWVDASPSLRPMSRHMYFVATLRVLRAAFPDTDWSAHMRFAKRLALIAGNGDASRKQGRILSSKVLLEAGLGHAQADAKIPNTPLARAKAQRDGTILALLAMMPIRHRSMSGLRIGHSVLVEGARLTLLLPRLLTKTKAVFEADVPEPAATALRQYISETRPFLMARSGSIHDHLWVGNQGKSMSYSYIGKKVPETTRRLTAISIPQQFFRDSAATTIARESPKAALMIAPVLGHTTARMAEKHYNQAGSIEVGRELASIIRRLKERG
ncbi:MAG: hypothetical protein ABI832_19550 [bacterium]